MQEPIFVLGKVVSAIILLWNHLEGDFVVEWEEVIEFVSQFMERNGIGAGQENRRIFVSRFLVR